MNKRLPRASAGVAFLGHRMGRDKEKAGGGISGWNPGDFIGINIDGWKGFLLQTVVNLWFSLHVLWLTDSIGCSFSPSSPPPPPLKCEAHVSTGALSFQV